ncbi:TolC family protein [Thermotoga caldifontis]|uniref:TolC family protein n=1 Tax=Thermotoga caldifontis TaxID=1508419 RepID=UPI000596E715|nr:TolC family protein [Thermotoga caldifontis]
MKRAVVVMLVVFVCSMFAGIIDALESAKSNSPAYLKLTLDREQAEDDYQKALLEARNKRQELSAQLSKMRADNTYRESLKSFVSDFLDTYFGVLDSQLALEIAQLNLQIAQIDYKEKKDLYDRGVGTLQDVKNASATLIEAEKDVDTAKLSVEQAKRDLQVLVGEKFEVKEPAKLNLNFSLPTVDELMDRSLTLAMARLNVQIAQMDLEGLVNPSQYTKNQYERNLKKAQADVQAYLLSLRKSYENQVQTVRNAIKSIQAQMEKIEVAKLQLDTVQKNFSAGVASERDVLNAKLSYTNARRTFLSQLKSLLKNVCNVYIDAELDFSKVLSTILGE